MKKQYIKSETEVWRVGYESNVPRTYKRYVKYEVSNLGRVKRNGELVEPQLQKNGYLRIGRFFVHWLVAKAFISNTENKPCIDHIDGNRLNNNSNNLRWVTRSENMCNPITKKRCSEAQKQHNKLYGSPIKGISKSEIHKKHLSEVHKNLHRVYHEDGTYHMEKNIQL